MPSLWLRCVYYLLWVRFIFAQWCYNQSIKMVQASAKDIADRLWGEP